MEHLTKRILALGAALLLALGAAACGQSNGPGARIDSGDSAVIDTAGMLSTDTENYVTNLSVALQNSCGAQIGVYTVDYIGNTTMEGYAYEVFNDWGLGDADKDNGILLLLAAGEDDYWLMRGSGLESALSSQTLKSLLDRELEPAWIGGDYDTGVRETAAALAEQLCSYYGLSMDIDGAAMGQSGTAAAPQRGGGGVSILTILLILIAVVLIIWVIGMASRGGRNGPPPPPPPPGGYGGYGGGTYTAPRRRSGFGSGFASGLGFGMGQSMGRRMFGGGSRRQGPPGPPPGGMGGPGMGGFSAPPRSGGMGRSFGGGAGRSFGGGGGIGRSGGSFRAGGGSARGGGAGRH